MQWNTDLPVNRAAWIEKNEAGTRNIGILHWASWNKNILFPEKSGNKVCLLCHFSVGYVHKTDFSCRNRSLFWVITDPNAIFFHRTVVWGLILRLQMEYFTVVTVTGRIAVSCTDSLKGTLLSGCSMQRKIKKISLATLWTATKTWVCRVCPHNLYHFSWKLWCGRWI